MAVSTKHKISRLDRLYEDERGYDFIGHTKRWYGITAALLVGAFVLGAVAGPTRSTGAPEDGDAGAETTVGGTTADDEATVGGAGEDPGLTTDGRRR